MEAKNWDKISKNYYEEIISPIKNSVKENPLLIDIKKLKAKTKNAIDLGCGTGALLPLLSKTFKKVEAIDYSKGMVEQAKKNKLKNVSYKVQDMKNLSMFKNKFDYAFSVNSILAKNVNDLNKTIKEIYKILKKGGKLYAVVPAIESFLYQAAIIIDKELEKGKTLAQAKKEAQKVVKKEEHDFLQGIITYEKEPQKALYRFEVLYRFKKAGFTNIKIKKIHYSWKEWKKAGQAYFPKEEEPWDWYVIAEKK